MPLTARHRGRVEARTICRGFHGFRSGLLRRSLLRARLHHPAGIRRAGSETLAPTGERSWPPKGAILTCYWGEGDAGRLTRLACAAQVAYPSVPGQPGKASVTASRGTTVAPPLLGRQHETRALASLLDALRAFYTRPRSITEMVDFVVGRVCDQFGVPHGLCPRWSESTEE